MPFRSFPPPSSSTNSKLPDLSSVHSSSSAQPPYTDPSDDSPLPSSTRSTDGFCSSFRQRHSDHFSRPSRLARARCSELLPENPNLHLSTLDPLPRMSSAQHPSPVASLQAAHLIGTRSGYSSSSSTSSSPSSCGIVSLPLDITNPPHRPSILQLKSSSFSSELDREEAWERKKEQNLSVNYNDGDDGDGSRELYGRDEVYDADDDADDDAFHDCDEEDWGETSEHHHVHHTPNNARKSPIIRRPLQRTRTRSLTDEDLDELRGSIELGFGFSHRESSNLKITLPALELYYAINRQYEDSKGRGSPITPLERTSSAGSNGSITNEAWRISSPGDHPSRVKTRLRHWAQVVACSIKQSF